MTRIPSSSPARWLAAIALAGLVMACSGNGATFDPAGPCVADGRAPGAYPSLEAGLPTSFRGTSPTTVDSGRSCTEAALGSLIAHDIDEVRFAGATWDLGNGTGMTSAVFELPAGADLPAEWLAEFYEVGARTAKRTENIETSRPTFGGAGETWRLDVLNELSLQSIVTWQDGPRVRVVLVATAVRPDASRADHDALVTDGVVATVAASGSVAATVAASGSG